MKINGNLGKITNLSHFADEDRFFMLFESASDGSTIRHVMKYDASEKTASLIETRNEWCNVTKDGYIISCAWNAFMTGTEKAEIVITDPSSNSKTVTFEYPFAPTNTFTGANITFAYDNSEYVAIVTYSPTHDFIEYTGNDFDIYEPIYVGIDRLGQTHIIDEFSNMFAEKSEYIASEGYSCISFGTIVSDNAVLINANTACYDFDMKLFCTDNGKIYDLNKSVEYPDVGQLADDTPAVDTEAPTDTDKGGSPDTGANGIAAAAALSIVALGAVMLSRKNR